MSNAQRIFSPIYTHLDNDNPSRALKECELVLKKNSKKGNALDKNGEVWQTTTVLKAIAFQRLNRVEEALQAAQTVCDAQPNDETLLQEFGLIFDFNNLTRANSLPYYIIFNQKKRCSRMFTAIWIVLK